jgi:hypothetical protein
MTQFPRRSAIGWVVMAVAALALLGGAPCVACAALAATSAATDTTPSASGATPRMMTAGRVTYLTGTTAYVDLGRDDGLGEGDRLEVVRGGKSVATLQVSYVSSHRAACAIQPPEATLAEGDPVRVVARATRADAAATAPVATASTNLVAAAPVRRKGSWLNEMGLRGRVGGRFLGLKDRSGTGANLKQPGLEMRVDGTRVGGAPIDLAVDVRARQTFQTLPDGGSQHAGQTRVYRLATTWHLPDPHFHVSVGRQFSSALSTVSTFDGVEAELDAGQVGVGIFTGTQPGPIDYSFSTDVWEHGLFFRVHGPGPTAQMAQVGQGGQMAARWEVVTAAIGSYQSGQINREYLTTQGRLDAHGLSLSLSQDLDLNRGWKRDAGEQAVSPTNTFVSARMRVAQRLDLDGGFDNRRNIRLYRDRITPETEFDDTYRQGIWGGSGLRVGGHLRVGATVRNSSGGAAGASTSWGMTAAASRLTPAQVDLRLRSTRYNSDLTEGWMHTLSGGVRPGQRLGLELFGGVRTDQGKIQGTSDARATWFGADMDLGVGRHWYLAISAERDERGPEQFDQVYGMLNYRF